MIYTASWEEILLTLLGIAALIYNLINLSASRFGYVAVKRQGVNGRLRRMAAQFLRNDAGRVWLQLGFLLFWVLALMSPNESSSEATLRSIVLRTVVIAMQTTLVLSGIADKVDREWMQSHPREYEDGDGSVEEVGNA